MGAYGKQDHGIAGSLYGSDYDIESKVVPSGVSFAFGDPVMVDTGDADTAYEPDSGDASLKFLGVATVSHRSYNSSEDVYEDFQEINVVSRGQVWVTVNSGLSSIANQAAYLIDDENDSGYKKFTTNSVGTYDTGCFFRSNVDGTLARLELRGLK